MAGKPKIDVLLVGGGGREHAIAWAMAKSPRLGRLICAPGNGGMAGIAECVDVAARDIDGVVALARSRGFGLVVVGPDDPLADGLVDALDAAGVRAFGPYRAAARLESSKAFAKGFMRRNGIPTAAYAAFTDAEADAAIKHVREHGAPIVVKADGLALGKGVVVAQSVGEAERAVRDVLEDKTFGEAACGSVVIEECLAGKEMTVLAFCDGKTLSPMPCAQDHKRAYDGDMGPNTGGMGAFAPSPAYSAAVGEECERSIFRPTLIGLEREGITYRGVLYFGLMATPSGVKLIEYNARFGDPEAQAVLPLLRTDILDIFDAAIDGRLDSISIEWDNLYSACVVAVSGGYPGKYGIGHEITISPCCEPPPFGLAAYFHAGTALRGGKLVTSGGRVVGSSALGRTLDEAIQGAYAGVRRVSFEGMRCRSDIGFSR